MQNDNATEPHLRVGGGCEALEGIDPALPVRVLQLRRDCQELSLQRFCADRSGPSRSHAGRLAARRLGAGRLAYADGLPPVAAAWRKQFECSDTPHG